MQVIVNDLLVNYEKSGKGPLVLMLHGWGDKADTYKDLSDDLKPKYTLVAPDLPGFGGTQAPTTVWSLDDYATFVRDFLHKLDMKPKTIIAHSNGGAVAIRGLAHEVLKADKLVLLSAAGIRDKHRKRFALNIIAKIGKVLTFWLPARHKKTLQKKLYGAAGSDMLVAPHLKETFRLTVRQDVQADAKLLNLPTLLIYGDQDKATPPEYGETYNRLIPKSELRIIDGSEHFVHQDKADTIAKLIEEFLK